MFVIKNHSTGKYFARRNGTYKNKIGYWTEWLDIKDNTVPTFETVEAAKDYIKITPFFEHEPKPDIVKIYKIEKYYEDTNPDVYHEKQKLIEKIENWDSHGDSIKSLMNAESLNHNVNYLLGDFKNKFKKCSEYFNVNYSDKVVDLNDIMSIKYPKTKKAREVAEFFAKLADCYYAVERWENAWKEAAIEEETK